MSNLLLLICINIKNSAIGETLILTSKYLTLGRFCLTYTCISLKGCLLSRGWLELDVGIHGSGNLVAGFNDGGGAVGDVAGQ